MKAGMTIQVLKTMVGNPVTRMVLSGMSNYCETDGKNRLEVALELYVGERDTACYKCKMALKPLSSVLKRGAKAFGVPEEEMKSAFKNSYYRKALASVIRGVADFGVKRPFIPGAPFQVVWDVTYACNLNCKHCYADAGKKRENELSDAEALELVDRLSDMGVTILAFSGGEPLIRGNIMELVKRASDNGMYASFATNGTLLTKEKVKESKEAGVQYLQISLDGATAEVHDAFRGSPGSFDRTIQGIKNCVEADLFVSVATTATKANYSQIPAIIDLCDELEVEWFMLYNFVPTGRGREVLEIDLSPDEREEMLNMLFSRMEDVECELLTTAPQFARVALQHCAGTGTLVVPTHFNNTRVGEDLFNITEFIGGCGAGRFYLAIRANGDIDPCVFFPLAVGNVREDDLKEIWKKNDILGDLRNKEILQDNCGSCEYRYHCGGCRARAYNYFNNYLAPDPGCVKNQRSYDTILKRIEVEDEMPNERIETVH